MDDLDKEGLLNELNVDDHSYSDELSTTDGLSHSDQFSHTDAYSHTDALSVTDSSSHTEELRSPGGISLDGDTYTVGDM